MSIIPKSNLLTLILLNAAYNGGKKIKEVCVIIIYIVKAFLNQGNILRSIYARFQPKLTDGKGIYLKSIWILQAKFDE